MLATVKTCDMPVQLSVIQNNRLNICALVKMIRLNLALRKHLNFIIRGKKPGKDNDTTSVSLLTVMTLLYFKGYLMTEYLLLKQSLERT